MRQNIADEVYKQMFDLLMKKKWAEGEKLPSENELKDMFGVSRNTVRSALNRLSLMGIVETRQGEGNYVKKIGVGLYMNALIPYIFLNDEDIFTIMDFRKGIEIQAARLAAKRGTDKDIEEIHNTLEACQADDVALGDYLQLDMTFHLSIAKASKNELLVQAMFIIKEYCYAALDNFVTDPIREKSRDYHQKVFESIKDHKADEAAAFMQAHLADVYTQIEANTDKKSEEAR